MGEKNKKKKRTYTRSRVTRAAQATKETDIEFTPMKVSDFVSTIDEKEMIYVGSGSGYFFIGEAGAFLRDLPAIDNAFQVSVKRKIKKNKKKPSEENIPIGDRKVKKYYRKLLNKGKGIIVEGSELGGFWTEKEFRTTMEASKNNYIRAYRSCCGI